MSESILASSATGQPETQTAEGEQQRVDLKAGKEARETKVRQEAEQAIDYCPEKTQLAGKQQRADFKVGVEARETKVRQEAQAIDYHYETRFIQVRALDTYRHETMFIRLCVMGSTAEIQAHLGQARSQGVEITQLVNRPASNGWTPLMIAAAGGMKEAVTLLLENGAKLDTIVKSHQWPNCGNAEFTAVKLAAKNGHWDTVLQLAAAGARINEIIPGEAYRNVLMQAIRKFSQTNWDDNGDHRASFIIKELIAKGGRILYREEFVEALSPLVQFKCWRILEQLLKYEPRGEDDESCQLDDRSFSYDGNCEPIKDPKTTRNILARVVSNGQTVILLALLRLGVPIEWSTFKTLKHMAKPYPHTYEVLNAVTTLFNIIDDTEPDVTREEQGRKLETALKTLGSASNVRRSCSEHEEVQSVVELAYEKGKLSVGKAVMLRGVHLNAFDLLEDAYRGQDKRAALVKAMLTLSYLIPQLNQLLKFKDQEKPRGWELQEADELIKDMLRISHKLCEDTIELQALEQEERDHLYYRLGELLEEMLPHCPKTENLESIIIGVFRRVSNETPKLYQMARDKIKDYQGSKQEESLTEISRLEARIQTLEERSGSMRREGLSVPGVLASQRGLIVSTMGPLILHQYQSSGASSSSAAVAASTQSSSLMTGVAASAAPTTESRKRKTPPGLGGSGHGGEGSD